MDTSLLVAAGASFFAGLLGYIIARLWIKPIAGYTITKRKLDRELNRYLAKINETCQPGDNRERQKKLEKTLRKARIHAMALVAGYHSDIPYWYRLLLDSRNESPMEASGRLTNLSKIHDQETVKRRINRAKKALRLT